MLRRLFPIVLTVSLLATPQIAITQSIDQLFDQGNTAQAEGKYTEAERIFRQVTQIDPNNAGAYNNLGNALSDQGKIEEAIAAYEQAIQLNPDYANAYYNLGVALRNQGKLEEAIAACKKAIELNPDNADAYIWLGNALYDQGKIEEAIAAWEKAIQLNPDYAPAYNNLGNALSDQGKIEEAIAAYEQAIQLNPDYATAYNNLGLAFSDQGKLEEAIAAYRKALSLPDEKGTAANAHTLAHNGLGFVFQKQGKYQEAIAEYEKAIKLDPNYAQAQNNLKEAQRLLAIANIPPILHNRQYLPSETDEPLVKKLRSTARIIATISEGANIGTGWVIQRQGNTVWIVTNRHVISDNRSKRPSDTIEIEFYSTLDDNKRPRYKATIEKITDSQDQLDLAVLKVEGIPDDIEPLKFKSGWVQRSLDVTIIGHPYNVNPWATPSGEVISYNPNHDFMMLDANVADGISGGPVLNEEGQVIAMMVRIRLQGDIVPIANRETQIILENPRSTGDVGLAYPIDIVIEKLQTWGFLEVRSQKSEVPRYAAARLHRSQNLLIYLN